MVKAVASWYQNVRTLPVSLSGKRSYLAIEVYQEYGELTNGVDVDILVVSIYARRNDAKNGFDDENSWYGAKETVVCN